MNADIKSPPFQFQLSEGYRAARRMNSFFCAIALAWSAAQFELKALSLGYFGNIDLSRASIPLILACAIAYSTIRLVLEFEMQSVEIRRWGFAQTDFKISIYLVRFSILILAASGLSRSLDTVVYIVLATVGAFLFFFIVWFLGTMGLSFVLITLRNRRGYSSAAAGAGTALNWAQLVTVCVLIIIFISLGIASLRYQPLLSLWNVPPSSIALGFFVFVCIAIMLSLYCQPWWYNKLFAIPRDYTEEIMADGKKRRIYRIDSNPITWDWYSQNVSEEKSQKQTSGE